MGRLSGRSALSSHGMHADAYRMSTSKVSVQPPVDVVDDAETEQRWLVWRAVMRAMRQVRPFTDLEEFSRFEPIVEEADLDSLEFEQLMAAVADESGILVPESDYPWVLTLDELERYLHKQVAHRAEPSR